ncbi:MAG TPA: ExeM/NucH family extracellular endonuclease [Anaerolineales bacterium]|nr:ExeM/NucH family extracellular endonuclease [Anaerolineales bacterium]
MNKLLPKMFSVMLIAALMMSMASITLPARAAPNLLPNPTSTVFINEIHYDNAGTDAGEAIEIAGPAGTDLTGWSIVLYNGSGGAVYDTDALSGIIPNQQAGYGTVFISYPSNGIQNGAPDGIALVNASSAVIQFLSYEGSFTAAGGPANGLVSTDIGVSQAGTDPAGQSLRLSGAGTTYGDFTWNASAASTFGAPNTGQSFGAADVAPSVSSTTPANGATNVAVNTNITVNFSESVDVAAGAITVECPAGNVVASSAVVDNLSSVVIDPASDLPVSTTCDINVSASGVTDEDTNDPPDAMTANFNSSFSTASPAVANDLVINEIDYDQPSTDTAEFVEIRNNDSVSVDLSAYDVQMVNGNAGGAVQYRLFDLPAISLAPGDYFVLCANNTTVANCDLDVTPETDLIQNGAPDAVALLFGASIVDTVSYEGNTGAPYTEGSGVGLVDTASGTQSISRCPDASDTDVNNVDFSERTSTPGTLNACVTDIPPAVTSTNPTNGAMNISITTNIDINFSEAVTATGNWFSISCANSGTHTATVSGGPQNYILDPDANFTFNELCTVTVFATQVADQDGDLDNMTNNFVFTFTTAAQPFGVCGDPATFIHDVQGSGLQSPINLMTGVIIEGIVVGDYQGAGQLGGYHLQEQDADADLNPATSEGIFVFNTSTPVNVGDLVRVRGRVFEFSTSGVFLTEMSPVTDVLVCSSGNSVIPTTVPLPVNTVDDWEAFEGMLVNIAQDLTVTENFTLGRFGEVALSANGRLLIPTMITTPGPAANAQQDLNNRSRILLDDGNGQQNIDPTIHPIGGLSASNTLRSGYTVNGLTGVLEQRFGVYRVQPVGPVVFNNTNPRPLSPDPVGGTLRVAAMNVLNYFTTLDAPGAGPFICGPLANLECRGANSASEFTRQRDKIISAIEGLDADVIGLMEMENNATTAIQNLVDGLNAATAPGTYAFIDTGTIGTDAIKVGLIYRPASVTPIGAYAILDSNVDPTFIDTLNRPVLAQTFEELATGAKFTVAVNHLKSKGSACGAGDPDTGDGQGNCNLTRLAAAIAEANWLATDPTGSGDPDFLLIGDFNAYLKEDPITALQNTGYTNLIDAFVGADAYSFVFQGQSGYLDHALSSSSLTSQVTGTTEWHVNSDEPIVLDYNEEFKSPNHVITLYEDDAYRSSDHDPLIVGLNLVNQPPTADAGGPYSVIEGGSVTLNATGSDPEGTAVTFEWDLDNDGTFETPGQSVSFSPSATAPAILTVKVKVTDAFGNFAVDEATVAVLYNFSGFFEPVDNLPTVNTVKAGQAIPIRFSLNGDHGLNIFAAGYPKIEFTSCTSSTVDVIETTVTAGNSSLSYDAATDQYTYVWKTDRAWANKCGTLQVQFNDGTTQTALFKFTR